MMEQQTKQRGYDAYAIVNGKGVDVDSAQKQLATYVELQMIKGWRPQGGVIFAGLFTESDGVTRFVFSQALLKLTKEE